MPFRNHIVYNQMAHTIRPLSLPSIEGRAVSKKRKKRRQLKTSDGETLDESRLLDPNYFYWAFIRPAEEEAEARRQKRAQRRAARRASAVEQEMTKPSSDEGP